ncbi:galactokinase [Phytophthora boehmeriae]|uniref:Galactokinase n=1 Tax=Phytophthora boehmeriae TaxID=109152 RepID=A0A8T1WTK0_9STRA|nr:galactokinase [Phytophthora boehmeriae]
MDTARFQALPLPASSAGSTAAQRVIQVADEFTRRFGRPPTGVARAPGRVNLIGEHVDYEGYSVLPMAIQQSVYVAFGVFNASHTGSNTEEVNVLSIVNVKAQYREVTVSLQAQESDQLKKLEQEGASWAKYVLSGVLGVRDESPEVFKGGERELKLLVDGDVPAGCGLSSSSALVVASALATSGALKQQLPGRVELAELCRQAEHRVGTMGGGMDQAVACLAQRGVALHLDFASVPAQSSRVQVGSETTGVTFVVANSLVVAEKAVDAVTHFNKRVVECALAAKMIAKGVGIEHWRKIDRLLDVHQALETARGESVRLEELQKLATNHCPLDEYSIHELEGGFGESLSVLFNGSSFEAAVTTVILSAKTFKLQQRARHVWSEAERVEKFRLLCAELTKDGQATCKEKELLALGNIMNSSHHSCQTLYECSCAELDSLVDEAMTAGALGARLTGAGWGGCIVALVRKTTVSNFMEALRSNYYALRGITSADTLYAMFESAPAEGADIFMT